MSAPALATWLLQKFRPSDEALLGDLLEERPNGRSTAWYWRQVVGAIVTGSVKDIRAHRLLALRAGATGWIVLLLFFAYGDVFADTLARYAWNWNRWIDGYGAGVWWPFNIAAAIVSYAGFSISTWAVARSHRSHALAMVVAYSCSVVVVLVSFMASAMLFGWLNRPTPLPHTLFYLVSVTLPYVWHSGFILVPLVMLLTGLVSCRPVPREQPSVRYTS